MEVSKQFPVMLLTGPRQVGKTTTLKRLAAVDGRKYVSLDDPATRALAREDPAKFIQANPPPVLIDEIQYAPDLLTYIKIAVDADRKPGMYWLTGSQQFALMKGVTESLAGRVALVRMLGMSHRERHKRDLIWPPFLPTSDIQELSARVKNTKGETLSEIFADIYNGSLPDIATGNVKERDVFYSSYIQTYLNRDLADVVRVSNDSMFMRFMKACAARTGQLLNMADLARDAGISITTAKTWLGALQATFQIVLLQPYYANITRRLVKTPKLFFLDTGLCSYLLESPSWQNFEDDRMAGPVFETFVLGEILKSWWHSIKDLNIFFYRDQAGNEIDFVIASEGNLYPVEVKKSATPQMDWGKSLTSPRFSMLNLSDGAVVCLKPDPMPLPNSKTMSIPISAI